MSYLQLARMAPTTRSEHWVLAIIVRLTLWNGSANRLISMRFSSSGIGPVFWMLQLASKARYISTMGAFLINNGAPKVLPFSAHDYRVIAYYEFNPLQLKAYRH